MYVTTTSTVEDGYNNLLGGVSIFIIRDHFYMDGPLVSIKVKLLHSNRITGIECDVR